LNEIDSMATAVMHNLLIQENHQFGATN